MINFRSIKEKGKELWVSIPNEAKFVASILFSWLVIFKSIFWWDDYSTHTEMVEECEEYAELLNLEDFKLIGEGNTADCYVKYNGNWMDRIQHEVFHEDMIRNMLMLEEAKIRKELIQIENANAEAEWKLKKSQEALQSWSDE